MSMSTRMGHHLPAGQAAPATRGPLRFELLAASRGKQEQGIAWSLVLVPQEGEGWKREKGRAERVLHAHILPLVSPDWSPCPKA